MRLSGGKKPVIITNSINKTVLLPLCDNKLDCTMLHLFDDLWLDKIIPKNNDEGRAIYGNLENKINTIYWPVENSIPKNNDRSRL
jgi:hypothetical protein